VKHENETWDIVSLSQDGESVTSRIVLASIKSKPLHLNIKHNFLLSYSSEDFTLLCTPLGDPEHPRRFTLPFHPTHAIPLSPHLDATLLLTANNT
jgi:hypothetical protein